MNWLFGGGAKQEAPGTQAQALRQKHIDQLRAHIPRLAEVQPQALFDAPCPLADGRVLNIRISLPPTFPNSPPVFTVIPLVHHPWVSPEGQIRGHEKLRSWSMHTNLGMVFNDITAAFQRDPPLPVGGSRYPGQQQPPPPQSTHPAGNPPYPQYQAQPYSGQNAGYGYPGGAPPSSQNPYGPPTGPPPPTNPYAGRPNQYGPPPTGGNHPPYGQPYGQAPGGSSVGSTAGLAASSGAVHPSTVVGGGGGAGQPYSQQPPYGQARPGGPPSQPQQPPQPQYGKTMLPAIPSSFPVLEKMSAAELDKLLNDETAFQELFNSLDQVKSFKAIRLELKESNEELAKNNLKKKERLDAAQAELDAMRSELREQEAAFQEKHVQQQEVLRRFAPPALAARLGEAAEQADAQSEAVLSQFSNKEIALPAFVQQYLAARKLYHLRMAKRARLEHTAMSEAGRFG